jgi:hypothetical protein
LAAWGCGSSSSTTTKDGAAGAGGTSGTSGAGGTSGTSGTSGAGGTSGTSGAGGTSGTSGTGGADASAGTGGTSDGSADDSSTSDATTSTDTTAADTGAAVDWTMCPGNSMLPGVSAADFCAQYAKACMFEASGGTTGKERYKDMADCMTRYAAANAPTMACIAYHLCAASASAAAGMTHCPHPPEASLATPAGPCKGM